MMTPFQEEINQGLPAKLPAKRSIPGDVNRAPKRKDILTAPAQYLWMHRRFKTRPAGEVPFYK